MKKLLTVLCLLAGYLAFTQTTLTLERFESVSDFYTAFNAGSGTVNVTKNATDYQSGQASMQVDYTFNVGGGAWFSSLINYATATKDWSFLPDKFILVHRGGHQSSGLRLRLWEDQDMNGQFDGQDEVFMSEPLAALGQQQWTQTAFDLQAFVKVAGAGNNLPDLSRIRAWDLAIYSDGTGHSGSLYLDELLLATTDEPPVAASMLTGSFIQLWNTAGCMCGQWTLQQWQNEFDRMRAVHLKSLVVQYGIYRDLAWYTPSALPYISYTQQTLNHIFQAAETTGLGIYVGLYFDEDWNQADKSAASTYSALLSKQRQMIDEVWDLFGHSDVFRGWYLPQEINDLEWQGMAEKNLLNEYLQAVAAHAHEKDAGKTVMIAPFFNLWQPADIIYDWYSHLLAHAPDIDLVCPQDGVGITLKDPAYHVPLYYEKIKQACAEHQVAFGATVESFRQLTGWPVDGGSFSAAPAAMEQFKKQLAAAGRFEPAEIIQFSWMYMQPDGDASQQLYDDYSVYTDSLLTGLPDEQSAHIGSEEDLYPAGDRLLIDGDETTHIRVYDWCGKLIFITTETEISLDDITPGLYYIVRVGERSKQIERWPVIKCRAY